jgi:hypothetical protein
MLSKEPLSLIIPLSWARADIIIKEQNLFDKAEKIVRQLSQYLIREE